VTSETSNVKCCDRFKEKHIDYSVLVILIYGYISSTIDVHVYTLDTMT